MIDEQEALMRNSESASAQDKDAPEMEAADQERSPIWDRWERWAESVDR